MISFRRALEDSQPEHRPFEAGSLPDSEKEALCLDLLGEFGAQNIRRRGDEIIHSCILPFGLHSNGDRNPSAPLNWKKLTYRCLSGETLVKTFDGERQIADLAGGVHRLLDGDGKWVMAPVRQYGVERLLKVTLSRNGVKKEIFATPDHRWYIKPRGSYDRTTLTEVTTSELRPRMRVPSVWAMTRVGRTTISPVGIMAGFVYGDGSRTEHGSVANFYGPKDEAMTRYFGGFDVIGGGEGLRKIVSGLPRSWKHLPDLDEGLSYLYGWLAGYFAADGCVADDGHITLASADLETLNHVIAICDRLGVATYTLGSRERRGINSKVSAIHQLSFRGSTLTADFFLNPRHRDRYEAALARRTYERTSWWVASVEETSRVEPVYCAEVATTRSFVLSGNILTGNCLGCDNGGGLLWFIATCRNESSAQARKWLSDQTGSGSDAQPLSAILKVIDDAFAIKGQRVPIPRMNSRILEPWYAIHPYMTEIRGVPAQTLMQHHVGWNPKTNRIVIPHFWKGDLVGWQTRRLVDDGTPKYESSGDFPKDVTVYNYVERADSALVVESAMSVLSKEHLGVHMEATFGAAVTDTQVRLLSRHPTVTLWFDNDSAGWKATEHVGEALGGWCNVFVVDSPWAADPADVDDQTFLDLVAGAVPFSIWQRPSVLIPWEG